MASHAISRPAALAMIAGCAGFLMIASTDTATAFQGCPTYVFLSSLGDLCWNGAWWPYQREDFHNDKDHKYKNRYVVNSNHPKPRWRFRNGHSSNTKHK